MKLLKLGLALCVLMIALTGCFEMKEPPTPNPNGVTIALHNVLSYIEPQGVKLEADVKSGETSEWVLNNIKPDDFKLKEKPPERISIYIFQNITEREKGFTDFNNKKAQYNMIVPIAWQSENVLVLYWHSSPGGQKPTFEDKISKGLKDWKMQFPNK
ncbi:hypothetical protein [Paenibacillus prosopidis]|uniref:Lipoprotein n=1 Tax=Paenibacillus prosopidis TaxID=630520 RepID=A0A368VG27_9BACL|nr:hypothetical protein [Paenibacillus prosopidis]RCW39230.1 hypothetical protein DFP97_1651 [Paenibacillus prosopidis]